MRIQFDSLRIHIELSVSHDYSVVQTEYKLLCASISSHRIVILHLELCHQLRYTVYC